jgi:hypothetical protein
MNLLNLFKVQKNLHHRINPKVYISFSPFIGRLFFLNLINYIQLRYGAFINFE